MSGYKILCPFHNESTPSCHVDGEKYKCFGCGKYGHVIDLGLQAKANQGPGRLVRINKLPPENLSAKLAEIAELPVKTIRGFELPCDDTGYYIVYPGGKYYTKRLFNPEKPSDKYRGPRGHRKPLYKVRLQRPQETLIIVEGQLNTLTLDECFRGHSTSTVSPGAASDLNRPEFVEYYLQYNNICVIVDKDAAGVVAGITLRDTLLAKGRRVNLHAVETDFNELLTQYGQEAVQSEIDKALRPLGVPGGVPERQESLSTPGEGTIKSV